MRSKIAVAVLSLAIAISGASTVAVAGGKKDPKDPPDPRTNLISVAKKSQGGWQTWCDVDPKCNGWGAWLTRKPKS